MKAQTYSSVTAFVAHWRALATKYPQQPDLDEKHRKLRIINEKLSEDDDRTLLAAMRDVIAALRPDERAALESDANTGAAERHRERAHASLARELRTRGLLAG